MPMTRSSASLGANARSALEMTLWLTPERNSSPRWLMAERARASTIATPKSSSPVMM